MLEIKTKRGTVQIKAEINAGGLVTCKSRLIEKDGYENRYMNFDFFPDSYPLSLWPIIEAYFGSKIWFTRARGEKIISFFREKFPCK